MKTSIRTRMFAPILIVLAALPFVLYGAFGALANQYVRGVARAELKATLGGVLDIASEVYDDEALEDLEAEDMQDLSRYFLDCIRELPQTEATQTRLIVVNGRMEIVYPGEGYQPYETDAFLDFLIESAQNESLAFSPKQIFELSYEGRAYMATFLRYAQASGDSVRYVIAYSPLYDAGALISASGKLVIYISAALALVIAVTVWILSSGLTRPLKQLGEQAGRMRVGDMKPVELRSDIREIDELTHAINDMARRIERYDADQKAFFHNVSHELRTPLMSIRGYAEGIALGVFDDEKAAAGVIVEQSVRLSDMVGELLTLSRLDEMQSDSAPRVLPLRDFLADQIEKMQGFALSRGVNVRLTGIQDALPAPFDPALMGQAFGNVLSNAIRYAEKRVDVRVFRADGAIRVDVRDDGPGFAPNDIPHLFERFYKGKDGAFGLGLAIAQNAMRRMGGSISAQNEGGARVTLTLPAAPGEAET